MKVNHNMTAVRTNLNLNRTNKKLDNTTYRLSSGYKINHAKDDPAGYAILRRLNRLVKGLDQADGNSGDAISAINTAEGGLMEIQAMLQRMNELAVQAANDTNTPEDRDTIQEEITQLKEEIDRIADTTEYNGRVMLNGDTDRTSYVAIADGGANDGTMANHIRVLSQSTTVFPGSYDLEVTSDPEQATLTFALAAGKIEVNGERLTVTQDEINSGAALSKLQTICDRCSITMEATGNSVTLTTMAYGEDAKIEVKVNSNPPLTAEGKDVVANITTANGGFSDTAVMSIKGNIITVTDTNGYELQIRTETGAAAEGTVKAEVKDASTLQIQVGSEADNMLEIVFERVSTETLHIDDVNVRTYAGAQLAIDAVQKAINKVSMMRSKLGAYENRLGYAQDSLSIQKYNVEDASSRMGDTDMAEDMTNYSQLNVLEQATSTILSKANQRAETILQLLQS